MNAPVDKTRVFIKGQNKVACYEKRKYNEIGFHISFEAFLYRSIKFSINLLFLKSDECEVVFVFVPNILMVLKCQQLRFE